MDLVIDTAKFGYLSLILAAAPKKYTKTFPIEPRESGKILECFDLFMRAAAKKNLHLDITRIVIYKGRGSFTGLRIGAAIAQALSLVWQVPIKVVKK